MLCCYLILLLLSHSKDTNTTKIPGDTLVFKKVQKSDIGVYICNTTGGIGGRFDSAVAEVKVKSEFACHSRGSFVFA